MSCGTVQVIYVDGSCLNPDQPNARAGYGVFYGDNNPRNAALPLMDKEQTNQRAEIAAVNYALKNSNYNQALNIYSDSTTTIAAMTKWREEWTRNGYVTRERKPVANADLIREGHRLLALHIAPVNFEYVAGHSGNHGNEQAHKLAAEGATRH
ncbi:hypothetical protein GGF46_003757 [Coemansia sp. RSA 552]|nr:hypothetical protein GGF46_003757 [Coemansia sp. RSA 552]